MLCYISPISFIIIAQHFLVPFSNANPLVEDKMLIAFVRNDQKIQISKYSKQKCEAHLGIIYYMRKNWQCNKIAKEFKEYERTEYQKYRKYLDILYEYLCREYFGIHTKKPKFVFKKRIEIEGPIIYAVNCLVNISQFFCSNGKGYVNWNNFFSLNCEPKLLNEERLDYGIKFENDQKVTINEMILQLAIDTANEWQTNESLDGIIQQNFDKNMEEMFKKAEEKAKEDNPWMANKINVNKHKIIWYSKFDDHSTWIEDALFSEFVKGLATNLEKFFKMVKEHSTIRQKYEAHLGFVYLMKTNWQCDEIADKLTEYERTECQKYRKYLDILYEYFFQFYVKAKNPKVSKQLPPLVKPIFSLGRFPISLIDVVKSFNLYWKCFWKKVEKLKLLNHYMGMNLRNEEDLHYGMRKVKSGENSPFKYEGEIISLRKEFMEKMCKNAIEEKARLEKAIQDAANDELKEDLIKEYYDNIGAFISSPFS